MAGFAERIRVGIANEHEVGAGHVDAFAATAFNVTLVVGIQFLLKWAVAEIEDDVLSGFPGSHQAIVAQISAAESNECSRKSHGYWTVKIWSVRNSD